ncbi:MAG: hypothetical protein COA33_013605 [Fluviicola sp.]|nr:hypothetical protein [Fluviicola sp.]
MRKNKRVIILLVVIIIGAYSFYITYDIIITFRFMFRNLSAHLSEAPIVIGVLATYVSISSVPSAIMNYNLINYKKTYLTGELIDDSLMDGEKNSNLNVNSFFLFSYISFGIAIVLFGLTALTYRLIDISHGSPVRLISIIIIAFVCILGTIFIIDYTRLKRIIKH